VRLFYLNLVCALLSLLGSVLWLLLGDAISGLVWAGASLLWVVVAVIRVRDSNIVPDAARRIGRRLSHLLLWG
jgi:hypothetical protein